MTVDTRDGRIYRAAAVAQLIAAGQLQEQDRDYIREMEHHPTPIQRARLRVGRNDPCPCGSRKKFKKCCLLRRE